MDLITVDSKPLSRSLPQLVPDSTCVRCDVCCRFPEADSFLRPYFTDREISEAVSHGVPASAFPDAAGSQVALVESPTGEGYLCPAFDVQSGRCGIYDVRPLDCQLYPLALMWDALGQEVVLGWDTKCPFMRDASSASIRAYAEQVAHRLADAATVEQIAAHPRLIGRFQEDVIVLTSLPLLTARLVLQRVDPRLRLLQPSDMSRVAQALDQAKVLHHDTPAAFAFPYHYIWTSLLPYWWLEIEETFFLFARSADGWFMPLPPLGAGPFERAVDQAFTLMHQWNGPSPVSRIENLTDIHRSQLSSDQNQFQKKEGDYLYAVAELVTLAGDRYKAQRALCNRVERDHVPAIEPYRAEHHDACQLLHRRWVEQKRQDTLDSMGKLLLEDSAAAHTCVLGEHEAIGLLGTVVTVNDDIMAYTFGYWVTPQTWCVLLEVADRSIPGLAQWLFRETCRTAAAQGAVYINAMDDAGLPGLRAAKLAYRPTAILDAWVITRMNS